jgi:hypothetical protein
MSRLSLNFGYALVSIPQKEALKGRTLGLSRHIKNEAGAKKRFMRAFPCGDKLRAGAKKLTGFADCPRNISGINLAWALEGAGSFSKCNAPC